MAYISNVNGEIVLNFYFQHRLWVGLWCSMDKQWTWHFANVTLP